MKTTIKYVLGFLFDQGGQFVALINKTKPEFQAGKINGIGGKIEPGELPVDAMSREFFEETGALVVGWRQFGQLASDTAPDGSWTVDLFLAFDDKIATLKTTTEEVVEVFPVSNLPANVIPNCRWMIPMALSLIKGERAVSFQVNEIN